MHGTGEREMRDPGKSKGKGKYGKGYGKSGKGKRPMSLVDQAQYATMEEGDCDWEHGGGGDEWTWDPAQQAGYTTDGQNQRAPWDNSPGPQDRMREPEGGVWIFVSLARRKQPTLRTMTPRTMNRPQGLGVMSMQVAENRVTNVKSRFRMFSEYQCQCCVADTEVNVHTEEDQDAIQQ